eukprot:SAG31_NODE_2571_length_5459_cov_7.139925_2_plen_163_part_00
MLTPLAPCYSNQYTSNGLEKIGVGQGGAQASLFDNLAATIANQRGISAPTAQLTVKMKAPARPIRMSFFASVARVYKHRVHVLRRADAAFVLCWKAGVFRVEGWIAAVSGRKITISMEMRDGDGILVSEAEALHIGPRSSVKAMKDVFPCTPEAPPKTTSRL